MTFLNSQTRFEAVELLPVLPDGTEDLAGLDSEGDPAVGGAVGDLGRGLAGGRPSEQLQALLGLLDEEAEVFVVKMWRLLIYEIENKRMKATAAAAMSGGGGS